MPQKTSIGKLLIQRALPEDLRPFVAAGSLDKKRLKELMMLVAKRHPDKYKDVLQSLHEIGEDVGSGYGGVGSLTLDSLVPNKELALIKNGIRKKIITLKSNPNLTPDQRDAKIIAVVQEGRDQLSSRISGSLESTAFGVQLKGGTRGSPSQVMSIITGDMLASDGMGKVIPLPLMRGYSEGLSPAEYWVAAQPARSGLIGTKLATPEAGNVANQLAISLHRLRITEAKEKSDRVGIPIDPSDSDYIGSVLSRDIPSIANAGDILTPELARVLKKVKKKKILIHSPITSQAEFGISQQAAGEWYNGLLPIGAFAGITAGQALSEPLSQVAISSKHQGQRTAPGLDLIKQLVTVPTHFPAEAPVSKASGRVLRIKDTATGAKSITIGNEEYIAPPGMEPLVELGDTVEQGQVLSQGMPNPRLLAQYRGIGAGRVEFARIFSKALKDSGIDHNKRNVEYLARGLINHVRITTPYKDWLPGDLVEFSRLSRTYKPRKGAALSRLNAAAGKYLEEPVGYFTIGTQLNKSTAKKLSDMGFDEVLVNTDAPPWTAEVRRGMEASMHSDDWLQRLGGYYLKDSFLDALHSGNAPAKPLDPTALFTQLVTTGAPTRLGKKK